MQPFNPTLPRCLQLVQARLDVTVMPTWRKSGRRLLSQNSQRACLSFPLCDTPGLSLVPLTTPNTGLRHPFVEGVPLLHPLPLFLFFLSSLSFLQKRKGAESDLSVLYRQTRGCIVC